MAIGDLAAWRQELLAIDLVQDEDDSIPEAEAVRRFDRYLALADAVTGTEGPSVVATLIASLTAVHDYGAHQAVYAALDLFPADDLAVGTASAAAALIAIPPDNSGQVLMAVAAASDTAVQAFNVAFAGLSPDLRDGLAALIERHERDEWLADERARGHLRPHTPLKA